ncbi:hypothetical protein CT19425_U610014 [Cupriavidus taiwanensis]|uniref:Uncharacterized protein n=1 Tax=Cupriavidus taiwanensis TaxID=164546 RepID=A0A375I932_9BURK|nr:hypothetical protein CT19425_U610014 [Cupriavidus taiwanensis]
MPVNMDTFFNPLPQSLTPVEF